jgi:hypothetical protein
LSGDITAADVLSQGSCDLLSEVGWKLQHLRSLSCGRAGLIYLDAGYGYAFYDSANPDKLSIVDLAGVHAKLERLMMEPADPNPLIKQLLESDLPQLTKTLEQMQKYFAGMPPAQIAGLSATASYRSPQAWAITFGRNTTRFLFRSLRFTLSRTTVQKLTKLKLQLLKRVCPRRMSSAFLTLSTILSTPMKPMCCAR